MITPTTKLTAVAAITLASAGLLAACGFSGSGSGGGANPSLTITSPSEGADVGSSVDVTWQTDVKLGDPDTGLDHVHVFVDGNSNDYTVVGGDQFMVKGLSPGQHTIDVTLQHADHSSAGASDAVDVTVTGPGGATSSPSPSPSETDSSGRYDY